MTTAVEAFPDVLAALSGTFAKCSSERACLF